MDMEHQGLPSLEDMALEQMKLYAEDLRELYRLERRRREELAEEKLILEYRLKELKALNELFQSHLKERFELEEVLKELLEELRRLAGELQGRPAERLEKLIARAEVRITKTKPAAPEPEQ